MSDMNLYSSPTPQRILVDAAKEMLRHAEPIEVLGSFGSHKEHPKNKTDTIVWRRLNPFNMKANGTPEINPAYFRLSEGVNPPSHSHTYTDVQGTLKQYGYIEKFSDKAADMYADDIPGDARKMTGMIMAEIAEMVRYGQLTAGTVVDYANGSGRGDVASRLEIKQVRRAIRTLESARAKFVTDRLKSGPNFGTSPIKPSFLCFHHTDVDSDIEDLPGFVPVEEYAASGSMVHPREKGAVGNLRFISSPLFVPFLGAGDTASGTGMKSEGGSNVDVYPLIITAMDAWGQVALKGPRSVRPILIPANSNSKSDPLGMTGYVGAKFWMEAVRLNENWMVRLEVGVSNLA